MSAESTGYWEEALVGSIFAAGFCLVENAVPFCPKAGARVLKKGELFVISWISLSRVGEAFPEAEGLCVEAEAEDHIPVLLHGTASEDGLSWAEPDCPVGDVSSDPMKSSQHRHVHYVVQIYDIDMQLTNLSILGSPCLCPADFRSPCCPIYYLSAIEDY